MIRYNIILMFLFVPILFFGQNNHATDLDYFLGSDFFKNYGLIKGESNNELHGFNSQKTDNPINRIVDIRWIFNNEKEAKKFLLDNLKKQSEDGNRFSFVLNNKNISEQYLYREGEEQKGMMEMFGLKGYTSWICIYRIKNVVAKIFLHGKQVPLSITTTVADSAANIICGKLNLKLSKEPSYKKVFEDSSFYSLSKNIYSIPSGFRVSQVEKPLEKYFDNELVYESTEKSLRIRYKFFDFNSNYYSDDSAKYVQNVLINFLTIPLNFYMLDLKNHNGIANKVLNKKVSGFLANCEYIMITKSAISKKSEISKDFKFGTTLCFVKKDHPILFVFYEFNSEEDYEIEYMNILSTIMYPK